MILGICNPNAYDLYDYDLQITGTVAPEFGNLTRLQFLYLNNNFLSGTISDNLAALNRLQQLDIADNRLSGSIPTWVSNFTLLDTFLAYGNDFSGPIKGLFNPANQKNLVTIDLSENQLTGSIPDELFQVYTHRALCFVYASDAISTE